MPAQAPGFFIFDAMTDSSLPDWPFLLRDRSGAVVIDVHVMPNAAHTAVQGMHDRALRIRLHAPPVDGKANLELQRWLADQLGLARSSVELVRGHSSRRKQLRIAAAEVTRARWEALLPPCGF